MRGFFIALTHLLKDEKTQVHGFVYLYDMTGYTMQHFTAFPSSEMKDMMSFQVNTVLDAPRQLQGIFIGILGSARVLLFSGKNARSFQRFLLLQHGSNF